MEEERKGGLRENRVILHPALAKAFQELMFMQLMRHEGREETRSGKMGQKWQGEGRACAKALRGGESLACSNSGKVASEGAGVVCQGEGNTKIPPQNSFPVISKCSLFGLK